MNSPRAFFDWSSTRSTRKRLTVVLSQEWSREIAQLNIWARNVEVVTYA